AYGTSTGVTNVGSGTSSTFPSLPASGLSCNTLYHFRIVGTNSAGTSNGLDNTFTTAACPPLPVVVTGSVTSITQTGGTLSGTVNPSGGGGGEGWFEYGLTAPAYGFTSSKAAIAGGSSPVAVNFAVTGLTCN